MADDIYPESSTHAKAVFREVLHPIELGFGNVDFWGQGNPENSEKNLKEQSKAENHLNVTYGAEWNPDHNDGGPVQLSLRPPCKPFLFH